LLSCTNDGRSVLHSNRLKDPDLPEGLAEEQDNVHFLDPLRDPRWSKFVNQNPAASVFHTAGWLHALQRAFGYEPIAVTLSAPSEKLRDALVFCVVRSWLTGTRLVALPFSDHCEPLVESADQFKALSSFIERIRKQQGWKYVEMRSANSALDFADQFQRATTFYLHQLDLRPNLDVLYNGFHKDCIQRKIRRANREGLTYEAGHTEALLQKLYPLLQMTRWRHHVPPQPIQWFRALIESMGEGLCIRVASKGGQPIAGTLTLSHGKKMVYKYGGSDARFNNLGGTPMLFWKAIQEAKEAGMEEFDLGRSDCQNLGLIRFKDRWSATRTTLTQWRFPCSASFPQLEKWKVDVAKQVLARLPKGVLTLAGNLLYRHIG
jgi:hypothetical protein